VAVLNITEVVGCDGGGHYRGGSGSGVGSNSGGSVGGGGHYRCGSGGVVGSYRSGSGGGVGYFRVEAVVV
jgi:hypothetical protein